jgi:hypothetical protein
VPPARPSAPPARPSAPPARPSAPPARPSASGSRPPPLPEGDSLGATEPNLPRIDSGDDAEPAPRFSQGPVPTSAAADDFSTTSPRPVLDDLGATTPRAALVADPAAGTGRARSLEELAGLPAAPWTAAGDAPAGRASRSSVPPPSPRPSQAALDAPAASSSSVTTAPDGAKRAPDAKRASDAKRAPDAAKQARPGSAEEPARGGRWWIPLLFLLLAAGAAGAAAYYFGLPI